MTHRCAAQLAQNVFQAQQHHASCWDDDCFVAVTLFQLQGVPATDTPSCVLQ
jgi:hypothetical protein